MSSYDISWKWGNEGDGRKVYDASGYGRIYAWGEISNWSDGDDTLSFTWTVYVCGTSGGGWDGPYKYGFNLAASYVYNGGEYHIDGGDTWYDGGTWRSNSVDISISKNNSTQSIALYLDMDSKSVNGYGAAPSAIIWDWVNIGSVSVSARAYYAHGNPTVSASKTTTHYSEEITLSWDKSSNQGNAGFDRFELWQGDTKLYSGSGTNYKVTPSDVTGAKGGTATYVLKEIHEWYGGYPSTQASIDITVRSGVVTVYDSNGTKHVGLVTAYDSNGKGHYVLITAYDSSGKAHNVV